MEPEASADDLLPGTMLGKYQIVRPLGRGGMGAVYEGLHTEIGKRVAVKTLNPEIAAMPGARARFLREAQLTSRVRHPHIVDVTDVGSEGGYAFLVMELLHGEDLAHRVARTGTLSLDATADILVPVCAAIDAAHANGIIHRDLKPQNIFLESSSTGIVPKVLDFGISKNRDLGASALTSSGAIVGTPYYLPPELIKDGRAATTASDQYALGVILYECLTGQRPYDGPTVFAIFQSVVEAKPVPLAQLRPDLPPAVANLVGRAMHPDLHARFESVRHLARALMTFASPWIRFQWESLLASAPVSGGAPTSLLEASPGQGAPSPAPGFAGTTPLPPFASGPSRSGSPSASPAPFSPFPVASPLPADRRLGLGASPVPRAETAALVDAGFPGSAGPPRTPRTPVRRPPSGQTWRAKERERSSLPYVLGGGILLAAAGLVAFLVLPGRPLHPPASRTTSRVAPPPGPGDDPPSRPASPPVRAAAVPVRFELEAEPAEAVVELDGRSLGQGHVTAEIFLDQDAHALRVSASGYEERTLTFLHELPPARIVLRRLPDTATPKPPKDDRPGPSRPSRRRPPRTNEVSADGVPVVE